jgi:putative transposase
MGRLLAKVARTDRRPAPRVHLVARPRQHQARRPTQAELVICDQAIDITEHPTREGKVYCAVVLDACSRRVVGWSIDAAPTAALVTNALSTAIERRRPAGPTVVHSDQGTQYGSWAFTRRAQEAGLLPSMGAVGTCFDNALMESFWSRVQVELLDRQAWSTRLELATALFEYLEIFHNRQRRHSSLGMLTPIEFESRQGSPAMSTVA